MTFKTENDTAVVAITSRCSSLTLIATSNSKCTHPEQTVYKQHFEYIYINKCQHTPLHFLTLMPQITSTSHSQKSIIRVVKSVLYYTDNSPPKLSGSVCIWATASCTLLVPNRYQKSSNGKGNFKTPLKYLSFMEGNKDKWKSWLCKRYNGLIKADGHQKTGFLKVLMPHKDNNVQN